MTKAPPEEQERLLELQALDAALVKTARRRAELRADPEAAAAREALEAARRALGEAEEAQAERDAALRASEREVQKVEDRIAKDRGQIDAGRGTARDMMALQHEIDSLTGRKSVLEDEELELMEAAESAAGDTERARAGAADAEREDGAQRARIEAELAELDAADSRTRAAREELAAALDPALVALYERRREHYGVGAARLRGDFSEGSGMTLSAGDLAEIRAAAADDVVFCPDSGAILVRTGA